MANQLFTMLARLNILQGNIDNYNVYIYILMILYILRFYLFTGLLTVVKYSKVHCLVTSEVKLWRCHRFVSEVFCADTTQQQRQSWNFSIHKISDFACMYDFYNNCKMWQSRHVINLMHWHYLASQSLVSCWYCLLNHVKYNTGDLRALQ